MRRQLLHVLRALAEPGRAHDTRTAAAIAIMMLIAIGIAIGYQAATAGL